MSINETAKIATGELLSVTPDVAQSTTSRLLNSSTATSYTEILASFASTQIDNPTLQIAIQNLLLQVNNPPVELGLGELIVWAMEQATPIAELISELANLDNGTDLAYLTETVGPGDGAQLGGLTESFLLDSDQRGLMELRLALRLTDYYARLLTSLLEQSRMTEASSEDIVSTIRFGMIFHALGNQFAQVVMYIENMHRAGIQSYLDTPDRLIHTLTAVVNSIRQAAESVNQISNTPRASVISYQAIQGIVEGFIAANDGISVAYQHNVIPQQFVYLNIPELDMELILKELLTNANKYGTGDAIVRLEANTNEPMTAPVKITIASTGYIIRDDHLLEMQHLIAGIAPNTAMFRVKGGTGLLRLGRLGNAHKLNCTAERGPDGDGVVITLEVPQGILGES